MYKRQVEEADKQSDPDDIYAAINWEDNPPINGFYEMVMNLTPERRKELRQEAERHRQEQPKAPTVQQAEHDTEVKKKEEVLDMKPRPYHRTPEMHLREGSLVARCV